MKTTSAMPFPVELEEIAGALDLYNWFGYWPDFHDAEVINLHLNRAGLSTLVIHTWEMTKEVDAQGFYVLRKHVVVEFRIKGISGLNLTGFNRQNVLFGLAIAKNDAGFELSLDPSYGLAGTILAERIEITITPGKPEG